MSMKMSELDQFFDSCGEILKHGARAWSEYIMKDRYQFVGVKKLSSLKKSLLQSYGYRTDFAKTIFWIFTGFCSLEYNEM